jgi:type II secretory pathway pseudopilin PulG
MERRSQPGEAACAVRPQAGFTYLGILVAVALMGLMLSAVGRVWAVHEQREREVQLLFVGDQYRMAIGRYYRSGRSYPMSLADLVQDDRSPLPRRFLRKLYADPMTGDADWTLIPAPGGGIMGVASASQAAPIKRAGFDLQDKAFADSDCYCKWRFIYDGTRLRGRQRRIG